MNTSDRLADIAAMVLEAGQPALFKRLIHASVVLSKHDTNKELDDGIQDDREDNDELYADDAEDVDDDEDTEAFVGLPVGAIGHKERRRGPHPKDVGIAKPDWWNP